MDPRLATIGKRLERIGRIVAVTGGKGGIGKSVVATTLALTCAERALRTGLLDLDLTSPCDHILLGLDEHNRTIDGRCFRPGVAGPNAACTKQQHAFHKKQNR